MIAQHGFDIYRVLCSGGTILMSLLYSLFVQHIIYSYAHFNVLCTLYKSLYTWKLAQVSFLNRPYFYKWKFLSRSWKLWRRFPSNWLVYRSSIYYFLHFHERFLHFHERLSWKHLQNQESVSCKLFHVSASDLHLHHGVRYRYGT